MTKHRRSLSVAGPVVLALTALLPAAAEAQSGQMNVTGFVRTPEGPLNLVFSMDKMTTDSTGRMFMSGKGGVAEMYKNDLAIYFSGDVVSSASGELRIDLGRDSRSFVVNAATRVCDAARKPIAAAKLAPGTAVTVRVRPDNVKQALQVSGGYLSMGPIGMGSEKAMHPECGAAARKGG